MNREIMTWAEVSRLSHPGASTFQFLNVKTYFSLAMFYKRGKKANWTTLVIDVTSLAFVVIWTSNIAAPWCNVCLTSLSFRSSLFMIVAVIADGMQGGRDSCSDLEEWTSVLWLWSGRMECGSGEKMLPLLNCLLMRNWFRCWKCMATLFCAQVLR